MVTVEESLGTINQVFETATVKTRPLIEAAHLHLVSLNPDVVIVPRLGEKSLAYGIGTKKMSEAYCYLIPFTEYVNLGFFHGASIDTDGILEGTGSKLRHLKIKSIEDLNNSQLTDLITRAQKDREQNAHNS